MKNWTPPVPAPMDPSLRTELLGEYRRLLRANRNPQEGDAARLQEVAELLNRDAANVTADLSTIDEITRLEIRAGMLSTELLEESKEAGDAHTAHVAETAAIIAARERQESWLVARATKLQREVQRAREAVTALKSLRSRCADLFDAEPVAEPTPAKPSPDASGEVEAGRRPGVHRAPVITTGS